MTDTDSDAEPDSTPATPALQTPPRSAKPEEYHHPWSLYHAAATPQSSPPASPSLPSLRLHSLGMSPFSPARRQFSSPLIKSASALHLAEAGRPGRESVVQDSKDVLVQRLNDLAAQLSKQDNIQEHNVNSLHAKVDEMEKALSTKDYPPSRRSLRSRPSSLILRDNRSERDSFWGPLTPGHTMPSISTTPLPTYASSSTQTEGSQTEGSPSTPKVAAAKGSHMSAAQANRIATEAQNLCKELEEVVSGLRARQEETEHIHELFITRAERAAQRIIHLEKRVKELECERNEGEMEMLSLQIQLKAIEVQCLSYVPKDADEELRESISAWKTEWSALKRKRARRKASAGEDTGTIGTPTRQSRNTSFPS
ncbi:hypothetical protein F5Y00DRAFT_228600 [Daldinia vernicosa]|uniref:uncharacterized protein n=1 Tax=Daldinia vernicosa TaxID=114800 RepID=UPI0020078364|nr:uncharacterized protein F5Y00DRAFT_228600 [Daldinia vernicosa]KAI0852084.1 hypothetical protein F5Y00DRAFT_228600 [Daldinia vernicosa]